MKHPALNFRHWLIILGMLFVGLVVSCYFYEQARGLKAELQATQERADQASKDLADLKAQAAKPTSFDDLLQDSIKQQFAGVVPDLVPAEGAAPSDRPRLSVTPDTLDLGTISQAKGVVKAIFKISNSGSLPLALQGSFTSCGCTAAPLIGQTLAPGKSIDFPVTYDPNYFGGAYGRGPIDKWIMIISNDPVDPFRKVYLKGDVLE